MAQCLLELALGCLACNRQVASVIAGAMTAEQVRENVAAFAESNKVQMTAVHVPEVLAAAAEIVHPELQRTGVELVIATDEVPRVTANFSQATVSCTIGTNPAALQITVDRLVLHVVGAVIIQGADGREEPA